VTTRTRGRARPLAGKPRAGRGGAAGPGAERPAGSPQRALEAQREFIADAAHELRTPLTALTLQVQLAERADDAVSRAEAFAELKGGLQRATHSVQQLLTLARQEPGGGERPLAAGESCRAGGTGHRRPSATGRSQADRSRGDTVAGACVVRGEHDALRILLGNLVSNALCYTPPGGKVDLATGQDEVGPFIEVCDSGPGIPLEDRERVFDRFYRRGQAGGPGSGLGLAIVKTIADRHQARVVLDDSRLGGLRARVEFPPAGSS
jgi:two-component system OmpR family sensor kinase